MDAAPPQPGRRAATRELGAPRSTRSRAVSRGWRTREAALLVAAAALLILAVGWRASRTGSGVDLLAAAASIGRQLPVTLPAAVLVSAAMALDVVAGAGLIRALRRRPFASWTEAVLAGAAGAVLVDASLVSVLGGIGWFRAPVVGAVLAVGAAAGAVQRPWVVRRPRPGRIRPAWVLLVAAVWCGPVIVALASPVVPAADVLPNHVGPAEHLRVFGSIATLATYPSPIYGPSRLFLGYEALFGTLATITGLPAALAAAVSALWLAILTALGARRLAGAVFDRRAADWALIAMALTFTFVRLVDVRDSVVALPIAALALARAVEQPHERWRRRRPAGEPAAPAVSGPDWILGSALAAAILVHPLVGALTWASVALITLADPTRRLVRTAPALACAAVASLPQLAVMLGATPAPIIGVLAVVGGTVAASLTAGLIGRIDMRRLGGTAARAAGTVQGHGGPLRGRRRFAAAFAAVAVLLAGVQVLRPATTAEVAGWVNPAFPVLFLAAGVVLASGPGRGARQLVAAGIAAGLAFLVGVSLASDTDAAGQALRYEVPKAVGYWLPWICAPALAGVLASAARRARRRPAWLMLPAGVLFVTLIPLGPARPNAAQASQPTADVLVWDLRIAQAGYWQGYPDPRAVVGPSGAAALAFLRGEIAAGRLVATDRLLHIARSFQPWASIPVAPFTGIDETVVADDGTASIFTAGGRVHPMADLESQLRGGFGWVLLEPAGLPPSVRAAIVGDGYRSVYRSAGEEVFAGPGVPQAAG